MINLHGWSIDVPTGLLLVFGLMIAIVMFRAQLGTRWGEAFVDENNKVSFTRLAIFFAFATQSWHLIYTTMNTVKKDEDLNALFPYYVTYAAVWSCAKAADKLIEVLRLYVAGRVPAAAPDRPS